MNDVFPQDESKFSHLFGKLSRSLSIPIEGRRGGVDKCSFGYDDAKVSPADNSDQDRQTDRQTGRPLRRAGARRRTTRTVVGSVNTPFLDNAASYVRSVKEKKQLYPARRKSFRKLYRFSLRLLLTSPGSHKHPIFLKCMALLHHGITSCNPH